MNTNRSSFVRATVLLLVVFLVALGVMTAAADSQFTDFEAFALGTVNGQDGWSKTGPYDVEVVDQATFGLTYPGFGSRSLRISNADVSGSFGDQTFSKSLVDEAGETAALNGGMSGGTRQAYYMAEWEFASVVPGAEQPNMYVTASPDRGDGARMSWVQMADLPAGLEVSFYDYVSATPGVCDGSFVYTVVAAGLDRTVKHSIRITMRFYDTTANDVVKVYVDGVLLHTGTSWEDYFRDCQPPGTRTVDSILFRVGGTVDYPANLGKGFLIDNFRQMSGPITEDIFMSATAAGTTADLVDFGAEDILKWDGTAWSLWFDGSAAGLTPVGKWKHNLNAIYIPDTAGDDVVVSFTQNARFVPGIVPKVDGMDLVWWDGSAWSLYFDGSDVGLTNKTQEKIDGLHILPASPGCVANLLISTQGPGRITNGNLPGFKFGGEDVLNFCATSLGANTAGVWSMVLDGSAEGMPRNSTDSISMGADGNTLYLTTKKTFNVDAASGGHSMVYTYDMTAGTFAGPYFDAPANGLPKQVDALQVYDLP